MNDAERRRMTRGTPKGAFTLIELLIVVAIIAILAAIAVPNFLEAQTRSKVSRARADMRTVATALEAYAVDNNEYPPNDGVYNVVPRELTTPVAFIASARLVDPFSDKLTDPVNGDLARFYTYTYILDCGDSPAPQCQEFLDAMAANRPPPIEAVDALGFNQGAIERYGKWRLVSNGPDQKYSDVSRFAATDPIRLGSDILYDPTNGTNSWGNLLRTHKDPEGSEKE